MRRRDNVSHLEHPAASSTLRAMHRAGCMAVLTLATIACLPAFAPKLTPDDVHADLSAASEADACMSCHVSESEALREGPSAAPIVADWMLDEPRGCTDCHALRSPRRARGGALEP